MKHLKKFNESLIRYPQMIEGLKRFNEGVKDINELQSFCDDYLAYLYDTGFIADVEFQYNHNNKNSQYIGITIKKSDTTTFYWENVKDYIIPFITILSEDYKLDRKRCIVFRGIKYYTYSDPYTQLGMDDIKYSSERISKIYTPKNIIDETLKFKDKLNSITIFIYLYK
jgi:hypothetical protein